MRLGRDRTRRLYATMVGAALVAVPVEVVLGTTPWALLALLAAPMLRQPLEAVATRTDGPSLNAALAGTGALLGAFSLLLTAGLLLSSA